MKEERKVKCTYVHAYSGEYTGTFSVDYTINKYQLCKNCLNTGSKFFNYVIPRAGDPILHHFIYCFDLIYYSLVFSN